MNTPLVVPTTQGPPSPPGNVSATTINSSQINLNWTASTSTVGIANYIVQRCQGAGCTNFVQVATPTGTSYSDLGLASNTTYVYQVLAKQLPIALIYVAARMCEEWRHGRCPFVCAAALVMVMVLKMVAVGCSNRKVDGNVYYQGTTSSSKPQTPPST